MNELNHLQHDELVKWQDRALKAEAANREQKAEIERLNELIEKAKLKCGEQFMAISDLRGYLIQAGREAGALLADEVSIEFLRHVPDEIRLKFASLRASVGEKWIDVKQELPDPGVNVLAIIQGYSHCSQHYTVYRTEPMGEDGFYTWRDSHYGNQSLWFTHWQPLPAPPTLPGEEK